MSTAVQASLATTPVDAAPSLRHTAVATLIAAVGSAAATAVIRLVAVGAFDIPQPGFAPLSPGPVLASSAAGTVGAGVVFAVLAGFARRPRRTFFAVASAFLLVSLFPALSLLAQSPAPFPGTGLAAVVTLVVMHIVVAAISVAVIAGRPLERDRLTGAAAVEEG